MLTWPIGRRSDSAMGTYADCGPEHTALLAAATYKDPANGRANTPLYGPAYYCHTIGANQTEVMPGKWWLPSPSDLFHMMKDVTYGTSAGAAYEDYDIVNKVLYKLNADTTDSTKGFRFSMLAATMFRWTSMRHSVNYVRNYGGIVGYIDYISDYNYAFATPITTVSF